MILSSLIKNIDVIQMLGNSECEVSGLALDSRSVVSGNAFFAVRGSAVDGHQYIDQAIHNGARAIFCETIPQNSYSHVTFVQVKNVQKIAGMVAANFFDNPAQKLTIIGVTGTNGKTTVASVLYEMLISLEYSAGLISTVENKINERIIPSTHTTPDPIQLHRLFREMLDGGCTHVCMEVSSHALDQDRVVGIDFSIAIFTNLTQDHLDYHHTMDEYLEAKKKFFDQLSSDAIAIINGDDPSAAKMVADTRARIITYGNKEAYDYHFTVTEMSATYSDVVLNDSAMILPFVGLFNVYNLAAVYAAGCELGMSNDRIIATLEHVRGVSGRMEFVSRHPIVGIVDYAHTPDAIENILTTLNAVQNDWKLIIVLGAGGDRDTTKRPVMGAIACLLSDHVIFTSDNPRSEDPEKILDDMTQDLDAKNFKRITDRQQAIEYAVLRANVGDIVVVAGKGHETYQEIAGIKHPFSDQKILAEAITQKVWE